MARRLPLLLALCVLAACGSSVNMSQPPATTTTTVAPTTTTRPSRPHHTTHHRVGSVTAIGDSTMVDAAPALRAMIPHVTVDAAVDRSALPGPPILSLLADSQRLGSEVVFALGTNGGLSAQLLDEVVRITTGRRLVMVTNHCRCGVAVPNNQLIRTRCTAARHCVVADWDALASAHPAWMAPDGVHMPVGGTGAVEYARLIRSKL